MVNTPVLLLAYNRLDTLEEVWAVLRAVRPRYLFASADGPKPNPTDRERTQAVRNFIQSQIDWPCDAYFNFPPENAGCKLGVANGISWFFSHVEAGIILEDDMLPHPSFFQYMEEMLERYKDDERIGIISGAQFYPNHPLLASGWDFTRMTFIEGWGTWRRVWAKYQVHPSDWELFRKQKFLRKRLVGIEPYISYLEVLMDGVMQGRLDTWDAQLSFMILREGLLNVVPQQNLIRNLGVGHPLATHVRKKGFRPYLPLQRWRGGEGPLGMQPNIPYERLFIFSSGFWGKVRNRLLYYQYAWGLKRVLPDEP
ncbi:MAG: glycosyltransferase family 2 protein [Bacteroidia bacterium]|nr:glycosyltransferase family 2 protein [Bacteroidia bacterium]